MDNIEIYQISSEDEIKKAAGLLSEEVVDAMRQGLPALAICAVLDGLAIGALAGGIDGEVFEICSIFVEPSYRRRGAGRALIEALEEMLSEEGMSIRIQYTLENDDNATLHPFFSRMGYEDDDISYPEYYIGYVNSLKVDYRLVKKVSGKILPFSEVSVGAIKQAMKASWDQAYPSVSGSGEDFDRELSFCVLNGSRITAYVAVEDRAQLPFPDILPKAEGCCQLLHTRRSHIL